MQRILPSLHNWRTVVAVLLVLMAVGVLFSRFALQPVPSMTEATVLQPTIEREELLDGGDTAAQLEAQVPATEAQAPVVSTPVQATMVVYVTGAVRAPDVYTLPAEARVKDLVMAAGGLTVDADSEHINLAEHLKDAEHVHVPRQGEAITPVAADAPHGTNVATETGVEDKPININTASVAELDTLPGIGPAFAQRIVDYRMANGPFASINDLTNVKGIGPTLLEQIAPKINTGTP